MTWRVSPNWTNTFSRASSWRLEGATFPKNFARNSRSASPKEAAQLETGPEPGQIACSMPSVLLRQIRTTLGEDAVTELLERAGLTYAPSYLDDVGNWIWHDEAERLLEAAVQLTGDDRIARRVGEEMV